MIKKVTVPFFVLLLMCGVGCGESVPTVKIGFVAPLTGDQAPHGEDMLNAAQLAIQHAQAEGAVLPGYQLELVALDDQRNPTQAVSAAKKLVSDKAVMAAIGHLNSSCTMPASAIYYQAGLLNITPVSSNPQISQQGFSTFYRTCATDDLQGPAAARFAINALNARSIFIIDDMTTYGRGLADAYQRELEKLGGTVLGHEGLAQGDKDFVPLLTKIKSMNPDLVYFAGMFPEGALLIKQHFELGMNSQFMGGDGLYDPVLIELATPEAAEGVIITTIGVDVHQLETARAFVKEYEETYGPIGAYSAYTYEATKIAIWAIRQAGVMDRSAVLDAMKNLKDYPGLFGLQNFDEHGDSLIRDIGIFEVRDGTFVSIKSLRFE